MKQVKFFTLTISIVLSTALSAAAFGPLEGRGPFGVKHLQMMQTILDLTDEQSKAVEEVFADVRGNMQVILHGYDLKRQDMKVLRTLTGKFQEEGRKELATVLTIEEMQAMLEQLFAGNALEFILLSPEDKQVSLQDTLGFDTEKASRVVGILEQKKFQYELVLANLGYDPEQIVTLCQELIFQREKVKQSLEEILYQEQIELLEKIGNNRRQQGHGSFAPFATEGQLP